MIVKSCLVFFLFHCFYLDINLIFSILYSINYFSFIFWYNIILFFLEEKSN